MPTIFLIIALAAIVALVLRIFLVTPPSALVAGLRRGLGVLLLGGAVGLMAIRQFALAVPLAAVGFAVLSRSGFFGIGGSGAPRSSGNVSSVRSAGLDMQLDHESGAMTGQVLAGRHEGKMLSELEFEALLEVMDDFAADTESIRLLEGYLDRVHPGWREDPQAGGSDRSGPSPGTIGMSADEAYEILGISSGSSETEIREAHRRLIKQVHPDRGGSTALAAKINEAKDKLLGGH